MSARWDWVSSWAAGPPPSAPLSFSAALESEHSVIDAGEQCNLPADGIGGLLGHDGVPPEDLYAKGREELARYPSVEARDVKASSAGKSSGGFTIETSDGTVEIAKRVLLTSGLDYGYPDVPGAAERWGRSVFHCPFCHGWEVRDRELGVLDPASTGATRAMLLRGWSDRVTLFTNGPAELEPADTERLQEAGIPVDERRIGELRGNDSDLAAIVFADGAQAPCEGLSWSRDSVSALAAGQGPGPQDDRGPSDGRERDRGRLGLLHERGERLRRGRRDGWDALGGQLRALEARRRSTRPYIVHSLV